MARRFFYRNVNARDHLEIFLVSAVSSLLLLRFYLSKTGYPQVGNATLHISHMLYGGLLMLVAVVLTVAFLGEAVRRWSALLGGAGFGIFIDELGKFITKDNNYFFKPTIGLIYAIFILLYLAFSFISRINKLTHAEYEINALNQLEEAVSHDLDKVEKWRIAELLSQADKNSPITKNLKHLLQQLETVATPEPNILQRILKYLDDQYAKFWHQRRSHQLVGFFFVAQAVIFLALTLITVFDNFHSLGSIFRAQDSYTHKLIIAELASSAVSGLVTLWGAIVLIQSRIEGFELLRRAVLINLLLTEFFIFSRIQLRALPGFLVNLALLLSLRYAINEEQRSSAR